MINAWSCRHAFILTGDAADALWRQVQDLLSDSQLEVHVVTIPSI